MADQKINRVYLQDGREAEQIVTEEGDTRVTEIHAEAPRQKYLESRITEKMRPVVVHREIETMKDGQVVEKVVESNEPEVKMEVRKHIMVDENVVSNEDIARLLMDLREVKDCNGTCACQSKKLMAVAEQQVEEQQKDKTWIALAAIGCVIFTQVATIAYLAVNVYMSR